MDVRFLNTIAEAYIDQNRLHDKLTKEQIFEDVYSLIKDLRENDITLYDHLYDTNVLQQQQIIKTYFDYQYKDHILHEAEPLTLLTVGGIAALFYFIYGNRINKSIFSGGQKIGKVGESIGKFLTKHGRYWKFRYAIIQQNSKKCYKVCGIDERDLSMWSYFSTGSKKPILSNVEGFKQGDCLKKCYVTYLIEALALLSKSYFVCLKNTGGFDQIQNLRPDDMLKTVSGLQLSAACNDYFTELKAGFDSFYDLLDYVHGKDEVQKRNSLQELKNKMIESRNEISKTKRMKQYR